jgi:hypothetical protein
VRESGTSSRRFLTRGSHRVDLEVGPTVNGVLCWRRRRRRETKGCRGGRPWLLRVQQAVGMGR